MLLRFRVTNYASLRDEQELSLIALDDHPHLAVVDVPLTKDRVLPAVGAFGANASGKSNVIKAMAFARQVVVGSHQSWLPESPIPRWPFRLDAGSRTAASAFVFDFVHEGVRYEYGFRLDDNAIHEEWLYYWPRAKRSTLFEREAMQLDFGPSLTGQKATIAELVRENSLFLSAAAANNHPQLRPLAAWFGQWRRASTNHREAPRELLDEEMLKLMRCADVGVVGSNLTVSAVEDRLRPAAGAGATLLAVGRHPSGPELELLHHGEAEGGEALPWSWESSGTQTWLWLVRQARSSLRHGTILIVDDLGCDLHPLLTAQFVGFFQNRATNPSGAQLVFTGHDVNLLGRHVEHRLHRDQIWLTEKGRDGSTKFYQLTEYGRVRDGLDDVEGRYLQGRYGGVPFFDRALIDGLWRADEHGS